MQYNNIDIFTLHGFCFSVFCIFSVPKISALLLISTKSKSSRGEGILMTKIINLL